ncbi:hypothetical protein [Pseudonocardia sp. GCM10023141]
MVSLALTAVIVGLVVYLAVTRRDVQSEVDIRAFPGWGRAISSRTDQ